MEGRDFSEIKAEELLKLKSDIVRLDSGFNNLKERLNDIHAQNKANFEKLFVEIEKVSRSLEAINHLNLKATMQEKAIADHDKEIALLKKDMDDTIKFDTETRKYTAELNQKLELHEKIEAERVKAVAKTLKIVMFVGQAVAGVVAYLIAHWGVK